MRRVVSVFVLAAASVFAAEKTPSEQSAPPTEDPMAGAKREFDGIKAARGLTEQPKAAASLPTFTAPELTLGTPTPRTKAKAKTAAELLAEKKSANWLVDAMMKTDPKAPKDPKDELESLDQKIDLLAQDQVDTKKTTNEKADVKPEAIAKGSPELNPLTRYMSGWMTPQDFTLLKSGMNGPTAESLISRGDTSGAGSVVNAALPSEAGGGALDLMALSRSGPATPSAAASATGNPYLQAFVPPAQNFQNFSSPPAAMSPAASAPSVFVPPAAPTPPVSRIPDFAKPATDEKYFKQLKRF